MKRVPVFEGLLSFQSFRVSSGLFRERSNTPVRSMRAMVEVGCSRPQFRSLI